MLTTTKDVTDSTNSIINRAKDSLAIRIVGDTRDIGNITELLWNIYGCTSLVAFHHVDVDLSVSISLGIEATAIDIIDARSGLDIDSNLTMSGNRGLDTARLQRAGISRFVTTAHEVLDDDGVTAVGLLDVHRDVTLYTTFRVITAIDILQDAAGDGQRDIAMDMRIIGATVNIFDGIS